MGDPSTGPGILPRKSSANNGADRAFRKKWNPVRLPPQRLERSEAVERLERLELVAAWVSNMPDVTG
jgi:hypothetical protein